MYLFRCSLRFLAFVDLLGTTYSASTLATGYGAHIAQPLLRKSVEGRENTLTEEEALKIIENSMRVLYYRDARSINKVTHFNHPSYSDLYSTSMSWFF
jgi:20S proteasome subunit beta 7